MTFFQRLFRKPDRGIAPHLYRQIVALARQPHWYVEGEVADSVDGRFDMIAAVLAMVLLRLEGEAGAVAPSTWIAECFVEDMDGQLRQIGIGDIVVGKHIGKMMGMLGGRLGAYRAGLAAGDLKSALVRNVYRGHAPADAALAHVEAGLVALRARFDAASVAAILSTGLPE
ncbi:ubiquinol-cytochrome C chaperone family protein [Sphingomonas sp.]|uniref:ubiquinol-cytochrome C chaperone family protein n=1 Tax=Sphingomonas sp. TaxID=28214 RepID=UPI001B1D4229|nr:ubiquinol-cytochrome C chaperone family protein [Sphingomonas sp.]MBO9712377.1 ubiquinol-cytochrome C chaperone [Sphingomonas sp.]